MKQTPYRSKPALVPSLSGWSQLLLLQSTGSALQHRVIWSLLFLRWEEKLASFPRSEDTWCPEWIGFREPSLLVKRHLPLTLSSSLSLPLSLSLSQIRIYTHSCFLVLMWKNNNLTASNKKKKFVAALIHSPSSVGPFSYLACSETCIPGRHGTGRDERLLLPLLPPRLAPAAPASAPDLGPGHWAASKCLALHLQGCARGSRVCLYMGKKIILFINTPAEQRYGCIIRTITDMHYLGPSGFHLSDKMKLASVEPLVDPTDSTLSVPDGI